MVTDPLFFRDLAYVFAAAVVGGGLAWFARQPLVLGYVLGGVLIGPFTPGPTVSDLHTFELFAEIGVVLLMFSIGSECSLHDLLRVKWVALVGGPLGILLSIGLGLGVGHLLGWTALQGAVVGAVVSVASTMVLGRLLLDRGDLHSRHGRISIGVSLVEDLAVVALTVLMPTLGAVSAERLPDMALAVGTTVLILGPFLLVSTRVVPAMLARVARSRNPELFVLVALAIALGMAAFTQALGLSLALGAFLAGLIISESDYAHETLARLLPLRDAFVALFFVTVGALCDPAAVWENLFLLGVLIGLVVAGKAVIRTAVVLLFGHPPATALLVGIALTQIGEFSFVLVQVARTAGHVGEDIYQATLAASLITILLNAALVRLTSGWLVAHARDRSAALDPGVAPAPGWRDHVVLCGFGRVGSAIGEALEAFGVRHVVIELDPDIVRALRARGVPALYGDAAHARLLQEAGAERASLVIVSLPEVARARLAVRCVRTLNQAVPVLARAHRTAEADELRAMGATEVIQPELEASATLIRHALRWLKLPKEPTLAYLERLRVAAGAAPADVDAGRGLPEVREVRLEAGAIADRTLREARPRERFGVVVVAVVRADGEVVLSPGAETVLRAGDTLRVFGLARQVDAFVAEAART